MSAKDLQALMQMVEEKSSVAEAVERIGYDDIDGLIKYARELGLTVDADDFAAMRDSLIEQGQDISDEALEGVAGGFLFRRRRPAPVIDPTPAPDLDVE